MARPKKKPAHEMTSEEAVRHLFGKKAHEHMKRVAKESEKPLRKNGTSTKNKHK